MKTIITTLVFVALMASQSHAGEKPRVGIYDSRAVAVAYGASEMRKTRKTPSDIARDTAQSALDEAKAEGNKTQITKLKAELMKLRMQRAGLAFGTAPVDDILDLIKDRTPKLKQTAKVDELVSKWNSKELAKHQSSELIDVTLLLVAEFDPSKKVLQSVWGVQQTKPMSSRKTDHAVKKGI
jgi:hypothetical protein